MDLKWHNYLYYEMLVGDLYSYSVAGRCSGFGEPPRVFHSVGEPLEKAFL